MNIVIPSRIALQPVHLELIRNLGAVFFDDIPKDYNEVLNRVKDTEILVANHINVTSDVIDHVKGLKYIISPAVGYEWIDVSYAIKKNISVINCPTFNTEAVAEYAIALLFASTRKIVESNKSLLSETWDPSRYIGIELSGKTLGLIGHGNIGRRIEEIASGIGMEVINTDSHSTSSDLDALLKKSDFICVCASSNSSTDNLLNKEKLDLIKPGAYIINIARGKIVDQIYLKDLIESGRISGAGIDVFDNEPSNSQMPDEKIMNITKTRNIIATPHIAYNTKESEYRFGEELYRCLLSCLEGKPINLVE